MGRVSAAEVKEILKTSVTISNADVDAYIIGANALITKAFENDVTINATHKKELERWLTAHMIAMTRERMPHKMGGGPAPSIEYVGKTGEGLKATYYGQVLIMMDTTGLIAALGRAAVSIDAITEGE